MNLITARHSECSDTHHLILFPRVDVVEARQQGRRATLAAPSSCNTSHMHINPLQAVPK
jgi:hypothetical protein